MIHYTAPSHDLCEDLAQEVYLKLNNNNARLLREFVPDHKDASFGYLKVMTARVVHDYFRSKGNIPFEPLPDDLPGPDEELNRRLLIREIDEFLAHAVSGRDREIFWLRWRSGMTAVQIAAIPAFGLRVKGVESVIKKVTDLVREGFGPDDTREVA